MSAGATTVEVRPTQRDGALAILGAAFFLACSWTWCIGMYLPVLLVRDYGVMGWVLFAVPNVLGAAAMGWVLRSRAASKRIAQEHAHACVVFSLVTIAFQLYFAGAYLSRWGTAGLWMGQAILLAFPVLSWMGSARWSRAAALWCVSGGLAVAYLCVAGYRPVSEAAAEPWALAGLGASCALGFLLCPYLDLTFLQTRGRLTPGAARGAFTLGFGVFFLAMIVFTLIYAPTVGARTAGAGLTLVAVHVALQLLFTIVIHARAVDESENVFHRMGLVPAWGLALALCIVVHIGRSEGWTANGMKLSELFYRLFMGMYGLVFPAYVWLCMAPFGGGKPTRRAMRVFAANVVLGGPMLWMAFVHGRMVWAVPAVGLVLLSRLVIGRRAAV